mmetsp:Transcript_42586/g.48937  ORF Transcript_42586/g.48937 Transcript_42586/m.48937 type:complete len:81 (-) Transcript_42586:801-1043(-)
MLLLLNREYLPLWHQGGCYLWFSPALLKQARKSRILELALVRYCLDIGGLSETVEFTQDCGETPKIDCRIMGPRQGSKSV